MKKLLFITLILQFCFLSAFAKEHFKRRSDVKKADPFCSKVGKAKDKKTGFKLKSTGKKRFKGFFCRKCKGETESTIDLINHVTWVGKNGEETEDDIKSPHKTCKASYKKFYYCEGVDDNDKPVVKEIEAISRKDAKKKLKKSLNRRVRVYKSESKAKKNKYCKEPKEFFYCEGFKDGKASVGKVKARNRKEAKKLAKKATGQSRVRVYKSESKAKKNKSCKAPKKFFYCTVTDGKRVVHTIEAAKKSKAKKQYKNDKSKYKGKLFNKENKAQDDKRCDESLAKPLTCYFCNPLSGQVETIEDVFVAGRLKARWRKKIKSCEDINKKRYIKFALSKPTFKEITRGLKAKQSEGNIWKTFARDFKKGRVNMIAASEDAARNKTYEKVSLCEIKEVKVEKTCKDFFGAKLGNSPATAVDIGNFADNKTMADKAKAYLKALKISDKEITPDLSNLRETKINGKDSKVMTYLVQREGVKCYAKASWVTEVEAPKSCKEIGINVDASNTIILSDSQGKVLSNFKTILKESESKCKQAGGQWISNINNAGKENLSCRIGEDVCKAEVQYRKVEDVNIPFDLTKGLQFDASLQILVHMQLTENDRKCIYRFLQKVEKQYEWGIKAKSYNKCKNRSGNPVDDSKISLKLHLVKMLSDVKSLGCDAVVKHAARDTKYVEGINFTTKEKCTSKIGGAKTTEKQMRVNGGKWQ